MFLFIVYNVDECKNYKRSFVRGSLGSVLVGFIYCCCYYCF